MLQHINTCVKCMPGLGGQVGHAISLADGFIYLQKKGVNENYKCEISNYIIKNSFGELYPANNS